jgi:hypothetical protein
MNQRHVAQMTQALGALLGQNMILMGLSVLEVPLRRFLEALGGASNCF